MTLTLDALRPYSAATETTPLTFTVGAPVETDNGSGADFVDIPISLALDPAAVTVVGVSFVTGETTVTSAPGTFSDLRVGMPVTSTTAYVAPSTVVAVTSDGATVEFADPAAATVVEDLTGDFAAADYAAFVVRITLAPSGTSVKGSVAIKALKEGAEVVPLTTPVEDLLVGSASASTLLDVDVFLDNRAVPRTDPV